MSIATTADGTEELAELVTQAARRLRRSARAQLSPLGLTYAQARLMRILDRAGRPLRMAEVAAALEIVPRSATSMVDGLESLGLVDRRADAADRRSVLVGLTTAGSGLLARMDAARRATAVEIFGPLERHDRRRLVALLRGVLASCPPAGGRCTPRPGGSERA